MKRILIALVFCLLLAPIASSAQAGMAPSPPTPPLMRSVVQSCAFGAGAFAATTYVGLTPVLLTRTFTLPVTEVIAANAIIGCGVGAAGAAASTVVGWIYDTIF